MEDEREVERVQRKSIFGANWGAISLIGPPLIKGIVVRIRCNLLLRQDSGSGKKKPDDTAIKLKKKEFGQVQEGGITRGR